MHVSYGELVRVCPEAIRMTGFTYGQADDAVEGIVWSECVLGRGYDLLRMADDRRAGKQWPKPRLEVQTDTARVALSGLPAYGFAARLADLAAELAESSNRNVGRVNAHGAFGGWIVPYIVYRLSRRGLRAAVLWRPSSPLNVDEAPAMLMLADPTTPGAAVPALSVIAAVLLPNAEQAVSPEMTVPLNLVRSIDAADQPASDESVIAIAAMPDSASADMLEAVPLSHALDELGLVGAAASLDASERVSAAVNRGLSVSPEKHAFLNALSQRIRMPNTERSKSQAG